jgi:ribosomal protein L39E
VGKGDKARFWHSNRINRQAPKNLALTLFHKVKRKKITVMKAMKSNRWVNHISPIQTTDELHEYISLWGEIGTVNRISPIQTTLSLKSRGKLSDLVVFGGA